MKKTTISLMLTLLILSTASVNAQVRIGGTDDPHQSAILDLNTDDESTAGSLGFSLPRVLLTSVKPELNDAPPLNGTVVWNTNDEFYLGKGVYVWGDTVWVPIQRTIFANGNLLPITTQPFVTVLSNPALGVGVTFQVPAAYADMGNTFRFLWEIEASGENYALKDSASGSRHEVLFVPYDDESRTYMAKAKAISNNGTSDTDWSEPVTSIAGKYQGWYRLTGATGYDIFSNDEETDPLYGRDRSQMDLSGEKNIYSVETFGGIGTATYKWTIERDETGFASLVGDGTGTTVELLFDEAILNKSYLKDDPAVADTIVLQCVVNDGREVYTLQRKITVGNRDECSPVAGLRDAEGNFYTVSKFGAAGCWMTQNLRSTYTWQGTQKQEITEDRNIDGDNNATFYYYPGADPNTLITNPEYGLLYTWGAANIGAVTTEATNAFPKGSDRQGICSEGWVVPSDYDWNQLEKEIATNPSLYSTQETPFAWNPIYEGMADWRPGEGSVNQTWWGRQMRSSTIKVNNTTVDGSSKEDGTGFNALLVGTPATLDYGTVTYFWSSSASSVIAAWHRILPKGYTSVHRSIRSKQSLLSVRCKKL
jgi:uncharacterized protein (TIGR02145 family)